MKGFGEAVGSIQTSRVTGWIRSGGRKKLEDRLTYGCRDKLTGRPELFATRTMSPSIIDRDMEQANSAAEENGPNPGEPPRFLSRRRWSQSTGRKSGSKIDLRKEQDRKQEANDSGLMRVIRS
ncbi:unnamed protein product [Lactuca virosa]|uniref:Uncharacterized protein n=1 Tax=Lactuca virosa TaxID=75947 RepID=A0AAU9LL97_9ASTR|nr:unnamed protein product [Lactuca virosa]